MLTESNPWEEQPGSGGTMPIPSGEEMVLINIGWDRSMAAKILDLSECGTLLNLTEQSGVYDAIDGECTITFRHQEEVFDIESRVVDQARDLIAFQFINPPAEVVNCIRTKISQMPDAKADKSNMTNIEKTSRDSSPGEHTCPTIAYSKSYSETTTAQDEMGPQTCEICSGKTPESSLCLACQEWVEQYARMLTGGQRRTFPSP